MDKNEKNNITDEITKTLTMLLYADKKLDECEIVEESNKEFLKGGNSI